MNGNDHPSATRPMGSGGHTELAAGPPRAPAPRGRNDELMAGSKTVFEFTGDAADGGRRSHRGTFTGSTLDLPHTDERRESNLRSGPSGWLFIGVAVLLCGGGLAWGLMSSGSEAEASEQPAPVAASAEAVASPAEGEAQVAPPETTPGEAAPGATPAETTPPAPAAKDAKAESPPADAKADPPPEDAKADPPPEDAKADPPPEPTKPASGGKNPRKPKRKSSGGSSSGGSSSGGKGKTLKPKKPPRDPLSNLPKPPGG